MNISYDSYRVFYYAAKYKSFSQAAAALYNNQPNITRIIRRLESELRCALFFRSAQGVRLTPEGEKLYAHIAVAFESIEAAEEEIFSDQSLQSGVVHIAASGLAGDLVSGISAALPPASPRVGIAAAIQADTIVALLPGLEI